MNTLFVPKYLHLTTVNLGYERYLRFLVLLPVTVLGEGDSGLAVAHPERRDPLLVQSTRIIPALRPDLPHNPLRTQVELQMHPAVWTQFNHFAAIM